MAGRWSDKQAGGVYSSDGILPTYSTGTGAPNHYYVSEAEGLNTAGGGASYAIDKNYHKGTSPGDIGSGRRTQIVRWQNKDAGAVVDDKAPSLRASGGTDIRKQPSFTSLF